MPGSTVSLSLELPGDQQAIFDLTQRAFATMQYSSGTEGYIIDALRRDGDLTLSLVARDGGTIVGHIAFSPVTLRSNRQARQPGSWFALGPVCVAPERQRQGIAGLLIKRGLAELQAAAAAGCVLLGDPAYYGRFGFQSGGLSSGTLPSEYIQWTRFGADRPAGEITFAPGFDAQADDTTKV